MHEQRSHPDADFCAHHVRLCVVGDELAWERIVDRFQGLVWVTALRCGLDPDDAADVFQFVWMELHQSLLRLRDPASLPKWLMVATRRQAYKVARARRRQQGGVPTDDPTLALADPRCSAEERLVSREDRSRLEQALAKMQPQDARLLYLLFLDPAQPDYQEISSQTGLAVGSIGPLRARCLRRLRQLLEATQ